MTESLAFAPKVRPAEITADFDSMRKRLDSLLEIYQDVDDDALDAMDIREIEGCHADVNAIIKSVEDGRKAVKRAYNEPLDRFEAEVKALLEPAREAKAQLAAARDRKRGRERDLRLEGLRSTYEDCAPALVPVVPFERILELNPSWANKTYGAAKAAQEIVDATAKIACDWDALRKMEGEMAFYKEAEAEFFRTLDLGKALALNASRIEEQDRIEAMRAEVDARRAEPAPEPEPEPEANAEPEPVRQFVFTVQCTDGQREQIIDFLRSIGVHGRVGKGA